ncbi:Uncharacterised protein [Proteus mirabilis]|nr:Uncharacterised protein [Proteus mirabilis]
MPALSIFVHGLPSGKPCTYTGMNSVIPYPINNYILKRYVVVIEPDNE